MGLGAEIWGRARRDLLLRVRPRDSMVGSEWSKRETGVVEERERKSESKPEELEVMSRNAD